MSTFPYQNLLPSTLLFNPHGSYPGLQTLMVPISHGSTSFLRTVVALLTTPTSLFGGCHPARYRTALALEQQTAPSSG